MLFYSWKLTLAVILIAGLMTVSTLPLLPVLRQRPAIFWSWRQKIKAFCGNFKGAMVIKATNAAPSSGKSFRVALVALANLSFSTIQIGIINSILLNLLAASAVLFCLDWGAYW